MTNTVTISTDEYEKLLNKKTWLQCLENAGVDNWDGMEFAYEEYRSLVPDDD